MSIESCLISMRRLKCTVSILLVCMQTSIAAYSQRITLNVRNIPLETVLDNIQSQTGYLVLYNNELIKNVGKVQANFRNLELNAAMQAILQGLPLTYDIQGKTILIKPSPTSQNEVARTQAIQESISGKVVNEKGEPLSGVSVSTTDRTASTQTNQQGNFELNGITGNAVLRFSMLGFQRVEYPANKLPSPIILIQEISNLDEIIVTGYGVQQRRSITGAMSTVKGEDFENMPVQSLDKAIQGRAAGVLVQT